MKLGHWKALAFLGMGAALFFACKESFDQSFTKMDTDGDGTSDIFIPSAYAQARSSAGVGHTNWRCGCQTKAYAVGIGGGTATTTTISQDVLNEWACLPGTLVPVNNSCYCCAATSAQGPPP